MKTIAPLQTFEQIKLLADSRRLNLLRLLMAAPATLSQLARQVGESPAWVQHHVRALLAGGLIEVTETHQPNGLIEKMYQASAGGFLLREMIVPPGPVVVFAGSHDLALEILTRKLQNQLNILFLPVGSLDGLLNLRQGLCAFSGSHILENDGQFNRSTVQHIFPEGDVSLVTLAYRIQGLMLAPGNPRGIRAVEDLTRPDVTFLNRNRGSGTRLWLERALARGGISGSQIHGFEKTVSTHSLAARAIQRGEADAALGLQAAALACGLDFLPLFEERYDLTLPVQTRQILSPLLQELTSAAFRRVGESLDGYAFNHCGEEISLQIFFDGEK